MSTLSRLSGLHYDAVGIEHAMAILFGDSLGARGLDHDADFFRSGDVADLSKVVARIAETVEQRARHLKFSDLENGSPAKRIESAISGLRSVAEAMSQSSEREPQDYHWLIVGELALIVASLLENQNV